jgi:hypothetical protein
MELMTTSCSCEKPIAIEKGERKGAARTECARCGLPVPLRLPGGPA